MRTNYMKYKVIAAVVLFVLYALISPAKAGIGDLEQDVIAELTVNGYPYKIGDFKGHHEIKAQAPDGILHIYIGSSGRVVECSFLCKVCGDTISPEAIKHLQSTYPVSWTQYQVTDTFVSYMSSDKHMVMMVGVKKPLVIITTEEGLQIHEVKDPDMEKI